MILSGHQPVYLPGIILFNKIALSDAFMFVGHAQLSNKSWHTRNRIALQGKEFFLSIPVEKAGRFGQSIDETTFADATWPRKHLGSLRQAYGKTPFFDTYFPGISTLLSRPWAGLGSLNKALIRQFLEWLDISTPIYDSADHAIEGAKTDMLISMCKAVGADAYLSNEGARDYVDQDRMAREGLRHFWQKYEPPAYGSFSTFLPNMSIVDLLFQLGPSSGEMVKTCGHIVSDQIFPDALS